MTDAINRKRNFIFSLILILQNISIFFFDIVKMVTGIQLICLFLYFISMILFGKRLKKKKFLVGWFGYVIVVLLNYFIGGDGNFIVAFTINSVMLFFLLSFPELQVIEIKIIKVFTCIHLFASILVYILPNSVVDSILKILLRDSFSSNYSWRVLANLNPGITSQPGVNAMYLVLSVFLAIAELVINKKKNVQNVIIIILSYAMIFTTAKRSAILITVIAIIIFWIMVNKNFIRHVSTNSIIKSILFVIIIAFVAYYIYNSTNIMQSVVKKITDTKLSGDTMNGRLFLWQIAEDSFKESPIYGVGLKSIYLKTGMDVHNVYLQIIAETGIIGFATFVIGIVSIVIKSFSNLNKALVYENDTYIKVAASFGFLLIIYLLVYGFVGNTFIDYLPIMLFVLAVFLTNVNETNGGR